MEPTVDNKQSESIFNLRYIIPYAGSFLIFFGATRLIFYYNSFGVSILDYITLNGVLISFLDMVTIIVIFSSYMILSSNLMKGKDQISEKSDFSKKFLGENNPFKRVWIFITMAKSNLFIVFLLLAILVIIEYINDDIVNFSFELITGTVALIFYIFIRLEINRKVKVDVLIESDKFKMMLSVNILIGLFTVYFISQQEVSDVTKNKSTYGTIINFTNNAPIISDSSFYYIGKTENSLFMYDQTKKETTVYKMDNIESIVYPK